MSFSDSKIRRRLQRLEDEASRHALRHHLRLGAMAIFGYIFPGLLLGVAAALLLALLMLLPGLGASVGFLHALLVSIIALAAIFAFVAGVVQATVVEVPDPEGLLLTASDAPALVSLIEDVRQRLRAPRTHEVYLDCRLNAGMAERRRSLLRRRRNLMLIGVPMLAVLTPGQFAIVIAHELGHASRRHGALSIWLFRVRRSWEQLADSEVTGRWIRAVRLDRLIRRYAGWFCLGTLAVARRHEYAADRSAADLHGQQATAEVLMYVDWVGYRLDHDYWPDLFRQAAGEPLPPADITDRVVAFLATPPDAGTLRNWRMLERTRRTHVFADHPCLRDRLAALGQQHLLDSDDPNSPVAGIPAAPAPDKTSLALLGVAGQRRIQAVNALWKTYAIARWRHEHAFARYLRRQIENPDDAHSEPATPLEQEFNRVQLELSAMPPRQAIESLQAFLQRNPGHADAAFALGQALLQRDDPRAVAVLDEVARTSTRYQGPALSMLLDHYRDLGDDEASDAIIRRMDEAGRQSKLDEHRVRRLRAAEEWQPHGLHDATIARLRRRLHLWHRITGAWLVRRPPRLAHDRAQYLLLFQWRHSFLGNGTRSDRAAAQSLEESLGIPVVVVPASSASRSARKSLQAVPDALIYDGR